ncbi:hypothetical protein B0T13DRAFT_52709 [Neurospora crassa]|nr:hypothetical protein B0T13DRAFT_52709 [Neurospora crassa]
MMKSRRGQGGVTVVVVMTGQGLVSPLGHARFHLASGRRKEFETPEFSCQSSTKRGHVSEKENEERVNETRTETTESDRKSRRWTLPTLSVVAVCLSVWQGRCKMSAYLVRPLTNQHPGSVDNDGCPDSQTSTKPRKRLQCKAGKSGRHPQGKVIFATWDSFGQVPGRSSREIEIASPRGPQCCV